MNTRTLFCLWRILCLGLCLGFSCIWLSGCGVSKHFSSQRAAVAEHDANCLWNIQIARDYTAQGRYELAKEHYLMALGACNDVESRNLVTHELRSVDLMIKAQR
ncbi:hypothetical protein LJC59_09565 [Desulfovibrio sp. OttesenSCG-928-A18]|nr:hypothetical protein [Desulfovibrio sp. OttesenSCG-928-A18]